MSIRAFPRAGISLDSALAREEWERERESGKLAFTFWRRKKRERETSASSRVKIQTSREGRPSSRERRFVRETFDEQLGRSGDGDGGGGGGHLLGNRERGGRERGRRSFEVDDEGHGSWAEIGKRETREIEIEEEDTCFFAGGKEGRFSRWWMQK